MAGRKSSSQWRIKLARRVHELVDEFGVKRFREMIAKWQEEYDKERRTFESLKERRLKHFQQALKQPALRDHTKQPGDGWEWCRGVIVVDTEVTVERPGTEALREDSVQPTLIHAWCPAQWARVTEPRPLFPIGAKRGPKTNIPPKSRSLTLAEKYTALASVHDSYWSIGEPIIPRPANTLDGPWVNWFRVVGAHGPANSDECYLEDFLKEVRKDLEATVAPSAPDQATDDSVWVSASKLCPDKSVSLKKARTFCEENGIRWRKPSKQRLDIHAGDWANCWAGKDAAGFEGLDEGGNKPSIFEKEDIVLDGATERLKQLQTKKKAGK
jgi:hypothetical protein